MCNNIMKKHCILQFRRFSSRIAEKPETTNKLVNNLSTLFVPNKYGGDMYQIVKPTIDLEYLNKNVELIQKSCDIRNINICMSEVINYASQWLMLMEKKENLSRTIDNLTRNMKLAKENNEESLTAMQHKKDLIKECNSCKEELYPLDDIVMPLFSQIPNIIHPNTPETNNISQIIRENYEFSFPIVSHVELGKSISCLTVSNVSPTAYYLTGKLAHLEQTIQSFFEEELENENFIPILGIDFAKSFIFEANGKDPYCSNDCITLKRVAGEHGQRINLIGGSSFEVFCAYFINMNADKNMLPLKYYSSGRFYNSAHCNDNVFSLFNVVQSNCLHCCIISEPDDADKCFDELHHSLMHCFSMLDLPYRIVHVSAQNLNHTENRRIQIELWSPFHQKYITCANVTQCNDFVSKRLQMSYGVHFQKNGYLNFVHGFAVNVPVLLGCLLENMQQPNCTFSIPTVLKKHMFD